MIELNKLELIEFQKHPKLTIDFSGGVNVLYGSSDSGKSCIRRAIEFLCQHSTFKGQRRVGSKTTSVKGYFSNNINVERIISNSINRYVITENGEEKVFDSVGKTAPEEVKQSIGIYPIKIDNIDIYLNSYIQVGLPFLFDQPPSARAKLFNTLTGNDVLDKLFSQFNKDILRIKKNLKEETQNFEDRETELKSKKTEVEKKEFIHKKLKKKINHIKELNEKYSKLVKLKELYENNVEETKKATKTLKTLKFIQPEVLQQLRTKIDRFDKLLTHKNALEKLEISINRVDGQIKDLKPLSIDTASLKGKIERFDTLKDISEKLSQKTVQFDRITKDLKILDKEIEHNNKELKKFKICPQCEGKGLIKNEGVKI